jgi:DNA adenine methylase
MPISDETTVVQPPQACPAFLRYPGAKWVCARWIIAHFPPHLCYLEPYAGSAACFFTKPPAKHSVLNDLCGDIVNLFRVIREQPEELAERLRLTPWAREEYLACYGWHEDAVERARRFFVRCWQAHGARLAGRSGWSRSSPVCSSRSQVWRKLPEALYLVAERLRLAEIESRPALQLIRDANYAHPETLLYVDPPYILSTRRERYYQIEMADADHVQLLEALDAHPGYVVLSGYAHPLYFSRLAHWQYVTHQVYSQGGRPRTEVLWLNPRVVQALAARQQQPALFGSVDEPPFMSADADASSVVCAEEEEQ